MIGPIPPWPRNQSHKVTDPPDPQDDNSSAPLAETFADDMAGLLAQARKRRARLLYATEEALPPLDADLDRLAAIRVPSVQPDLLPGHSSFARKSRELALEFAGGSELALLNALLVANLRKRAFPRHAPVLFRRLWAEKAASLLAELPPRWLISSLITFADHGEDEADRRIGQSLGMLFSLMKLYEAERQFSGLAADQPYSLVGRKVSPLPLDMRGFGLIGGDLEAHLFRPLILEAAKAPVAGPLARELLRRLNRDPGNIFRRLKLMRERRTALRARAPRDADQPDS